MLVPRSRFVFVCLAVALVLLASRPTEACLGGLGALGGEGAHGGGCCPAPPCGAVPTCGSYSSSYGGGPVGGGYQQPYSG